MNGSLVAPARVGEVASPEFLWPPGRAFLTAEWRHLAMLNYKVDPQVLEPLVPAGTQLDLFEGECYASVVGFLFQQTRVRGVPIPWHRHFEEVNLRFYVYRETAGEVRRGVAFVRELVPRRAVALVANLLYDEKYATVPMSHRITGPGAANGEPPEQVLYSWTAHGASNHLRISIEEASRNLVPGSHEEFIAEHYWGYTALRRGAAEYQVAHPRWRYAPAAAAELQCDVARLYGPQFAPFLSGEPASAFWAEGSAVRVYPGRRI